MAGEEGNRLLDLAEQRAETETFRAHVQTARLPIWYVQLATNRVTGDARKDLVARFLSVARQAGISNISEGMDLDKWAKKMSQE